MKNIIDELQVIIAEGFHQEVKLIQRRPNLYQLFVPYFYPDGDMVEVFIEPKSDSVFEISDQGLTLMRISYEFSMESKNKKKLLNEIIQQFGVIENNGKLSMDANKTELFSYLMQFLQVITKVSDISYLKREVVKSLFYEYFDSYVNDKFKGLDVIKDYYPDFDKEKQYPTPYAVLKPSKLLPVCLYPIASDDKCNETTITIQHYEIHDFRPDTIAVFENQEEMGRKPLARLSNIVGKQFATLQGNEERILGYAHRLLA